MGAVEKRFCRSCFYDLTGLTEHRCPECGRAFDPRNLKSFRTAPRRRIPYLKLALLAAVVTVISLSPAGYRRYQAHVALQRQASLAVLRTMGMRDFDGSAIAGGTSFTVYFPSLQKTPRPAGYWAKAIGEISKLGPVGIGIGDEAISKEEFASLLSLKNVQAFACNGLTDTTAVGLTSPSVQMLWLRDAQITDATVERLEKIRSLRWTVLDAPGITDPALQRLRDARPDLVVTRAIVETSPQTPKSDIVLETRVEKLDVVRYRADRTIDWKNSFNYPAESRRAQLVTSPGRVIVAHAGELTALNSETGWLLWKKSGSASNVLVSGDLLLSLEPSGDRQASEVHLVGRDLKSGDTLFDTVALKGPSLRPEPIRQVGDLFLVQNVWFSPAKSGLFNRSGTLRHGLQEHVIEGRHVGNVDVLLTDQSVKRIPPADGLITTSLFSAAGRGGDDGHLISLSDGDLLAFTYGRICDSGVQLQRINPTTGAVAWKADCMSLGVGHSAYEQNVTVTVQGQTIIVTSRASGGDFIELLDLTTGRQIKRWRF